MNGPKRIQDERYAHRADTLPGIDPEQPWHRAASLLETSCGLPLNVMELIPPAWIERYGLSACEGCARARQEAVA